MRLRVVMGEVADQDVDVIVRSAPASLVGRTPDGLLSAAGPDVVAACRQLGRGGLTRRIAMGEAVSTGAGQLLARYLVHAVVPTYSIREERSYLVTSAYRAALHVADGLSATRLAMVPFGATPPYWPLDLAVRMCLGTLAHTPTSVREVRLVLSNPAALEPFAEALARR